MKKILLVLNFVLIMMAFGCQDIELNRFKQNYDFPFPVKQKPDLIFKEHESLVGTELAFVWQTDFECTNYSNIKNGLIQSYEAYLESNLTYELDEQFFDEHIVFVYYNVSSNKKHEYRHIQAVVDEGGTFKFRIETDKRNYENIKFNHSKLFVWLFAFEKPDVTINKGYHLYHSNPIYHDPASYLTLYFDSSVIDSPNLIDEFIIKYPIIKAFYIEDSAKQLIRYRVSNQKVTLEDIQLLLEDALKDELILSYNLANEYYEVNEYKDQLKDALILRDGLIYNDIDYDGDLLHFVDYESFYEYFYSLTNSPMVTNGTEYYIPRNNPNFEPHLYGYYQTVFDKYDEEFFQTNDLILFGITHGSGSIGNFIDENTIEDDEITINLYYIIPPVGTDDMAYYTAYIPVPKGYDQFKLNVKTITLFSIEQ